MRKKANYLSGTIGKTMFKTALSMLPGTIAVSGYNLADTYFVAMLGTLPLAAMGFTFPVIMILGCIFHGLGVGVMATVAHAVGGEKRAKAAKLVTSGMILVAAVSAILGLIGYFSVDWTFRQLGAVGEVCTPIGEYMNIWYLGCVTGAVTMVGNSLLVAVGDSKLAGFFMMTGLVLNVLLDPLFIFTFKWGIEGAAWATILSQAVSLGVQLKLFSRKSELLHLRRGIYKLRADIVRQTLAIGLSPFLVNSCSCLVVLICNNRLLQFGGDMAIGAYGIVNRVLFFFITIVIGLIQGMQPIVGYNWGAHLNNRVWAVLRYGMIGGSIITTCAFLVAELIPGVVVQAFGAGPELTSLSEHGFRIIAALFPIVGIQMVIGNFFQSIGHAGKSIFLSLTRQLLFLIPLLALLPEWWGLDGVFWAMPASDIISFFVACGMLVWQMKHIKAHNPTEKARG